ncbi:hypothetical protein MBLNU230_g2841t1 [Neophaeotheca triangularis]
MDIFDIEPVRNQSVALIGILTALLTLYVTSHVVHCICVHPLHHIPGPKINALSRIPYIRHLILGTTGENVKALHQKYGQVVRISPNEISFSSGDTAWQDIYGFRTGKHKGQAEMSKDPACEKVLAEQEVLLQGYVDLLILRLKETLSTSDASVDLVKWYNWTTFDITADLLFGQPFGCLEDTQTHPYIELLFKPFSFTRVHYLMKYYPMFKRLTKYVVDPTIVQGRLEYLKWVYRQSRNRQAMETQRPDFITYIQAHNNDGSNNMSSEEIDSNSSTLLTAGSETTATLLSGVTYLLLKNPNVLRKLQDDIRGRWKTYNEIKLEQVNRAPYLVAVLAEGLRYFPPIPTGLARVVPPGGAVISGHYVPEQTSVYVSSLAVGHSEGNFKDPEAFVPERWLGDARYADDKRSSAKAFSFGPRACLGKNLAYAEMRLILAKMVWSFDWELMAQSATWMADCRVETLWKKPELAVKLTEVVRE